MRPAGGASGIARLRPVAVPLGATLAVQAAVSLAAMAVPVLAPAMAADLGVAPTWIGYYTGTLYLAAALSSAWAPRVVRPLGALTASLACLLLAALGLFLIGGTGSRLLAAVAGTLVLGIGYGLTNPASSEILAPRTPETLRGLVFSLKQTGVPLGGALAGAVVAPLLLVSGWRGAALVLAAFCLLLALGLSPLRRPLDGPRRARHPASGRGGGRSPLALALAEPRLRRLVLASFTFAGMQVSLSSFLVVQLVDAAGLDVVAAGLLLSAALVAGVAGRILWGWLADRPAAGGRAVLVGLALAMSAFALAAGSFGPDWPGGLLAAVCVGFGATAVGWNGVFLAEVVRLAPAGQAGVATGGALAVTYLGVVAGPPLFGLTVGLSGGSYATAYALAAALTLLGGALVWRAR